MKQKKVMEEKSKINEASVKTKVRMTDNKRCIAETRSGEHRTMCLHECHLCTLPRSYCNWHKESSLVIQKPTGYPIHIKSVTDRNLYFRDQREKRSRFERRQRVRGRDIVHRLHRR